MDYSKKIADGFSAAAALEPYSVLYLQTPWNKLTMDELSALPVDKICKDDSTLFMWSDSYSLSKAVKLMDKWGFEYKSIASIVDVAEKLPAMPVEEKHEEDKEKDLEAESDAEGPADPAADPAAEPAAESAAGPNEKAKPKRQARIKSVQPYPWWDGSASLSRVSTEHLLCATRGVGAAVSPKFKLAPFQVLYLPELSKAKSKARQAAPHTDPDWCFKRPAEVLDTVKMYAVAESRIIDLFGDTMHADIASLSPVLPHGFVDALKTGEPGSVLIANEAIGDLGKVALKSIAAKLRKSLAIKPPADDAEAAPKEAVVDELMKKCGPEWTTFDHERILSAVADYKLSNCSTRARKLKRTAKQNTSNGVERKRHGIASPSEISDQLCDFLEIAHGTQIARTEMVKRVNLYIKEHNLKDKRIVKLDERLTKLLGEPKEPVTFFSLCFSVSPHFSSKITPEFAEFLGLDKNSVPKIKALKMVNDWAAENKCVDTEGAITPSGKLADLLGPGIIPAHKLDEALNVLFPKKAKAAKSPDGQPAAKRSKISV